MAAKKKAFFEPPTQSKPPAHASTAQFPIVGIGASAGGLDTLEQFLRAVPPASGMAFVIVQHMDPTQKAHLAEILQRATTSKVQEVRRATKIRQDCVYVTPPNRDLIVRHGILRPSVPQGRRGFRLPIDLFFRSLAEDQGLYSAGVVLSGMGSDGTLGLRAVKERGGFAFAQDPESAKFDSMPRSAVDSGVVDFVAPAGELMGRVTALFARTQVLPLTAAGETPTKSQEAGLDKILLFLRIRTGSDFSLYKKNTVQRRVVRRMSLHKIKSLPVYLEFLRNNPQEADLLFRELLIGVTSFFRDPEVWEQLKNLAIPALLASRPPLSPLRVWVPGCSTGEEAYTIGILLLEALAEMTPEERPALQIFGTDLDREAVELARQGVFGRAIEENVSAARLARFFSKESDGHYRAQKELRDVMVFAPQNVIMDPPFTKLDILSCRNVLIYFTSAIQNKLVPLFHYSLKPGSILLLGTAESVGPATFLFDPLNRVNKIFVRKGVSGPAEHIEFPPTFVPRIQPKPPAGGAPPHLPRIKALADELLLRNYSPPAVLVDSSGYILFVSGRTGAFLEAAAGKANWNIFAMAREGLREKLAILFKKALHSNQTAILNGLKVSGEGAVWSLDLIVRPIQRPGTADRMVMIIFANATLPVAGVKNDGHRKQRAAAVDAAERFEQLTADLAAARDQMQTSQEELKSANEELQSTNEELQSTNEELTTSKEELQSLNEELQTVNAELHSKVDELEAANSDMKNLLNSTNIATVFLDSELCVRRFTTQACKIIRLIPTDIGRPITDIASNVIYPELAEDAEQVLRSLVFIDKVVTGRGGDIFSVRILPYRTETNRIEGVVILFSDVTQTYSTEARLRENNELFRVLFDAIGEGAILQSSDGTIQFANRAATEILGGSIEELKKRPPPDAGWQAVEEDGSPLLAAEYPSSMVLATGLAVHKKRLGIVNSTSGRRVWLQMTATRIEQRPGEGGASFALTVFTEVSNSLLANAPANAAAAGARSV